MRFSYQGDRWFHAASTFKAGLLFALFKAVEAGGCGWTISSRCGTDF